MELEDAKGRGKSLAGSYAGLIFVIMFWGTTPVINPYIYKYVAPTVTTFITGLAAFLSLLPVCLRKRSLLTRDFFKLALPTGLISSLASIVQKIGLLYTTPARYAFLENLSCVVVPIMMFVCVRKNPTK